MTDKRGPFIYVIRDGNREIPVEIRRSARKTLGLEVKSDGQVLARVPMRLADGTVKKFLEEHRDWILTKSQLVAERQKAGESTYATPVKDLTPDELEKIKEKFADRVLFYSEKMGVTFGKITIRNQKTRWGSCSSKGNLNFNYQLYYLPDKLLDYVVVHELAHRRHMNHSPEFWQEVGTYFPGYQECRKELKKVTLQ